MDGVFVVGLVIGGVISQCWFGNWHGGLLFGSVLALFYRVFIEK